MKAKFRLLLWAGPIITAVTIGLCSFTQWAAKSIWGIDLPEQDQIQLVRQLLQVGGPLQLTVAFAQILILAPVLEELLFRLLLFRLPTRFVERKTGLERNTNGVVMLVTVSALAVVSSAVFSLAHYVDILKLVKLWIVEWRQFSNAFLALFFFGLAQCWLYQRTRNIVFPMINHVFFNTVNLVILLFML